MKNFVNILRKGEGYVSVETIIVAGLMIGIGAYAIREFYLVGKDITNDSIDKVLEVQDIGDTLGDA